MEEYRCFPSHCPYRPAIGIYLSSMWLGSGRDGPSAVDYSRHPACSGCHIKSVCFTSHHHFLHLRRAVHRPALCRGRDYGKADKERSGDKLKQHHYGLHIFPRILVAPYQYIRSTPRLHALCSGRSVYAFAEYARRTA